MAKEKNATVNRRFFYYTVDIKHIDGAPNTAITCKDPKASLIETFKRIQKLKYHNSIFTPQYVVHQNSDGNYIYIIIDNLKSNKIEFRLLLCRDKLLPYIEENGKLTPLSNLLANSFQRMAEITHCIFFLNTNTMAMEYNFAGAKIKELAEYLINKADYEYLSDISFLNLININTLKKLKANEEMSLLSIKVNANAYVINELIKADPSFKALNCNVDNVDQVELILRRRVSKKKSGFIINGINSTFIGKLFVNNKSDFGRFKVRYGYGTEEIDLLSDNFICKESFVPVGKTKTIDSEEAYQKMFQYYKDNVVNQVKKDKN